MSDLVGVIGTLAGTVLGAFLANALQVRGEQRARLRETAETAVQTALESMTYFVGVEAFLLGKAPEPGDPRDIGADVARTVARLRSAPLAVNEAYGVLADRWRDTALVQMSGNPVERELARTGVMEAIGAFESSIDVELGRSWLRDLIDWLRRRPRTLRP